MCKSDFYLLPTNKLYEKEKTFQLKNFPAGYVGSFYRNLSDNVDNFLGLISIREQQLMQVSLKKMFKNIF